MNKKIISLMAALILTFSSYTSMSVNAQQATETIQFSTEGKIVAGRTYVPIRYAATIVGATTQWNQKDKTITITTKDIALTLKSDSKKVVLNGQSIELDVPVKIYDGISYIQVKALANLLGATVTWDQQSKITTFMYSNNLLKIYNSAASNYSELSQKQIDAFIQKANEAVDLSKYEQKRTHFQPYFSDVYINKLIVNKGVSDKHLFNTTAYAFSDGSKATITQFISPGGSGGLYIERNIELKKTNKGWFVVDINFMYLTP